MKQIQTRTLISTFSKYVTRYWPRLLLGLFFVLLSNLVRLIAPFIMRDAIDALTAEVTQAKIVHYAQLLVSVALIEGLIIFTQRNVIVRTSFKIVFDLRNDFYAHLQRLPVSFYHTQRTGDLMARAVNDIGIMRAVIGPGLVSVTNTLFTICVIVPTMLGINLKLTLLAFLPLPFIAVLSLLFSRRVRDRSRKVQDSYGLLSSDVQESIVGMRTIRAFARERTKLQSFDNLNSELVEKNVDLIRFSAFFQVLMQFVIGLGGVAIFWYSGSLIIDKVITLGQSVQFGVYLGNLVGRITTLGWIINLAQRCLACLDRINGIMSIKPLIGGTESEGTINQIKGEIEFRNLTYSYNGPGSAVLKDINLRIGAGQTVAFVGPVGSGKSTLMNLVPRLVEAPAGQVLIDGVPIHEIPLKVLRSSIGYVPQDTYLFSDTVRENIIFGNQDASPAAISRAAEQAGIAEDIEEFPQGYETLVGERGLMVSGGQAQRTAVARALICDPRILILDDALSMVDAGTEEKILAHLQLVMRSRTSLVVSHRVSTVRHADLIVVLDGGLVVETGTHDELIKRGGVYAGLFRKQLLEEQLAAS